MKARHSDVLDPLQNILDCAAMILQARKVQKQYGGNWPAMIGEMDHVAEIHRQMKEVEKVTV